MRLLLIEDDEAVAQVLAEAFGSQGHETIIRYTGEDGLAYLTSERPDAVVLDVREARDDQHRLGAARERLAVGVEHDSGLLGIGRTCDKGERHAPLRVASAPDGLTRTDKRVRPLCR